MLSFDYALTPALKKKLEGIDTLKEELVHLSINPLQEKRLHRYSSFNSIYYSLLLSGIAVYSRDVEKFLYTDEPIKLTESKPLHIEIVRR